MTGGSGLQEHNGLGSLVAMREQAAGGEASSRGMVSSGAAAGLGPLQDSARAMGR